MQGKYRVIIITIALAIMLTAAIAMAGWGDALKQTGAQYADEGATAAGLPYTPSEAITGIKNILSLGTESATSSLSKQGGFSSNPATTFSLPDSLKSLGGDSSGLLSALNSAAEGAVPGTGNIFLDAIQNLNITDASALLGGGEDAITRFFESSSRDTIKKLVKPVVSKSVDAAGVGTYLNAMMATQQATGIGGPPFDATEFVTDRTLDSMFSLIAMKEKDIRSTGGVGTTDLIQKLF